MAKGTPSNRTMGATVHRTTITLADVVWEMAAELMKLKGFNNNFSSYVADLIRRDKEEQDRARK